MIIDILIKVPFVTYIILLLIGMKKDSAKISVYFLYQYTFVALLGLVFESFNMGIFLIVNLLALIIGILKISKKGKRSKFIRILRYQILSFSTYYIYIYILLILIGGLNV